MKTLAASIGLLVSACALAVGVSSARAQTAPPPPPPAIPVHTFSGTWREIGEQQGRAGYSAIRAFSSAMSRLFSEQEAADYYGRLVREHMMRDDVQEQLKGIAAGLAGKDPADDIDEAKAFRMVAQVNLMMAILASRQPQCTAVAFSSAAGTFLAHNSDLGLSSRDSDELHLFRPTNGGHAFVSINYAGAVGGVLAQNDQGLALTYNVGRPNRNPAPGTNYLLAMREVITTASTVDEAVKYFRDFVASGRYFMASGANILVLDHKDGKMARIQVTSREVKVTPGAPLTAGVTSVAATNHWDAVDASFPAPTADDPRNTSSLRRQQRLRQLLPSFKDYGAVTAWRILTDTTAADGTQGPNDDTICRRGPRVSSVDAIVFARNFISYAPGPPCEYVERYGLPLIIKSPSAAGNSAFVNDVAAFLAQWKQAWASGPRR